MLVVNQSIFKHKIKTLRREIHHSQTYQEDYIKILIIYLRDFVRKKNQ